MPKKEDDNKKIIVRALVNVATICIILIMLVATVKICFGLITGGW